MPSAGECPARPAHGWNVGYSVGPAGPGPPVLHTGSAPPAPSAGAGRIGGPGCVERGPGLRGAWPGTLLGPEGTGCCACCAVSLLCFPGLLCRVVRVPGLPGVCGWCAAGRVAGGGVFGCAGSRLVPWVVRAGDWSLVENCTVDASICGQVFKGARWMPWYQEPMKDAGGRDRPRGAANRAVIRGCPNGETRQPSWAVTRC